MSSHQADLIISNLRTIEILLVLIWVTLVTIAFDVGVIKKRKRDHADKGE